MPPDIRDALIRIFDEKLPREQHLAAVAKVFFARGHDPAVWDRGWYPGVVESQRSALQATPVDSWWGAGVAPLLVLQAEQDAAAPNENAAALVDAYGKRVTVVEVANAGHALLPEQPDFIARSILDWLKR
jgi:pimeloyl-ACP methyl ester carboxylesterase